MVVLKVKSFAIRWRIFRYKTSSKHLLLFEDNEDTKMKKTGFYIIKDQFFEDMNDPYLKGNKSHYYCFEDSTTGIYWMIPLSSRIENAGVSCKRKNKQESHVISSILLN